MPNANTLKWRFDVNTFRLLGRDLITDRITALFELVKNSYDANAENVTIQFLNIGLRNDNSKIIIKDDGIGMSLDDIENKWMVIGTFNKRRDLYSPKPYKRRYIGEKGIGRFAVDKLGSYVHIKTKQENDEKELVVTINWQTYQDLAENLQTKLKLFTDIENEYEYVESTFTKGTILEILLPREIWTLDDIERAYKELSRLVSPFHEAKYPFNISIHAPEYEPFAVAKPIESDEKKFASHNFELDYDMKTNQQEYLYFDKVERKVVKQLGEKPSFGFVKFYLYYFDAEAKNRFNTFHKGTSVRIDGIKIYRDGILTTPFAEYEAEDEKRRDVLGVNKRRWRATFDRVGTRDVIGFIEITKEGNPEIIDVTNRQGFMDTHEFKDLKEFVYEQLDTFMETRKVERAEKKLIQEDTFEHAQVIIKQLNQNIQKVLNNKKASNNQKDTVTQIAEQMIEVEKGLQAITIEYKETKKEEERKEKMYFSLMSLSLFAANISHAVRTTIYSINDDAVYINEEPFTPQNEIVFKKYANRIHTEIQRLLKVVDFMLKYAKTDLPAEYFNVNEVIINTFDAHETIFSQKKINIDLDIESNLSLYGNKVFFQDIITNLISNSIKATEGNFVKNIRCIAHANNSNMNIVFSDDGIGIPKKNKEKVFDMYFTTTQEQGGAGIGLYVVKTNVETLGGKVEVLDNKSDTFGTSISITIPFKK